MTLRISIIGAGYVGLVTGVCLADKGHAVACVDIDAAKVDAINRAVPPIHEEGLEALLKKHAGGALRATTDLESAVLGSDLTFIATGTPFDGKVIDLRFVKEVATQIGAALRKKRTYHVVIVKSTVVPGTTDDVVLPLLEEASGKQAGRDFGVGMNPEFLSEGVAIEDFMHPDRIVLGGINDRAIDMLAEVYAAFGNVPTLRTNNKTAEMVKYASNALQATAISFANEIGNLCASIGGMDVVEVMKGVHAMKELNPRATPAESGPRVRAGIANFLATGCGFGGSCFPKDLKALASHGARIGHPMRLLEAVLAINQHQPHKLTELLHREIGSLHGAAVAVLGLAFKPGTDDMRESPAITVVDDLLAEGAWVRAYDPIAMPEAKKRFGDRLPLAETMEQAIEGAQAIVIVTRWDEFLRLPALVADLSQPPVVVDGRRMLAPNSVLRYAGIGL